MNFPLSEAFPSGSENESTCNAGNPGSVPGSGGRSPGERNGYPLQFSCLENSMATVCGALQRVGHDLVTNTFTFMGLLGWSSWGREKSFSVPLETFNPFSVQRPFIEHLLLPGAVLNTEFSEEWDVVLLLGSLLVSVQPRFFLSVYKWVRCELPRGFQVFA